MHISDAAVRGDLVIKGSEYKGAFGGKSKAVVKLNTEGQVLSLFDSAGIGAVRSGFFEFGLMVQRFLILHHAHSQICMTHLNKHQKRADAATRALESSLLK